MISYKFFIRLKNGRETDRDETGETFKECLVKAKNEAAFMGGEVIAWASLNDEQD